MVSAISLVAGCSAGVVVEDPPPASVISSTPRGMTTDQSSTGELPHALPYAQWFTLIEPPPPLAAYAAYIDGPPLTAADVEATKQRAVQSQAAIATCMAALGFRYVPDPPNITIESQSTHFGNHLQYFHLPFLSDSRDVVAKDGYGVMSLRDEAEAEGLFSNPNAEYQASLSPAEADAYSRALYGDYNDPAGTVADSCSGKAAAQFPASENSRKRQDAFLAEYGSLAGETVNYVMAVMGVGWQGVKGIDPRVAQINQEWESCMAVKGYVFEFESDLIAAPVDAMNRAIETRPDGTFTTPSIGANVFDQPDGETSLLGTEAERRVALADFDCRVETDYLSRLTAIRVDLDNVFLKTHREALDALAAAAQSW